MQNSERITKIPVLESIILCKLETFFSNYQHIMEQILTTTPYPGRSLMNLLLCCSQGYRCRWLCPKTLCQSFPLYHSVDCQALHNQKLLGGNETIYLCIYIYIHAYNIQQHSQSFVVIEVTVCYKHKESNPFWSVWQSQVWFRNTICYIQYVHAYWSWPLDLLCNWWRCLWLQYRTRTKIKHLYYGKKLED